MTSMSLPNGYEEFRATPISFLQGEDQLLLTWFFNQDTAFAYVPFVYDINEDSWDQRDGFF